MTDDLQALAKLAKESEGFPFLCPLCYRGLMTLEEKADHLRDAHGYRVIVFGTPQ